MTPCPAHPDAEAVGTCHRCGRFYCAPEAMLLDGQLYCAECGARDDVDWLGKWARRYEGKRSGLAWALLPLGGLLLAFSTVVLVTDPGGWQPYVLALGFACFGLPAAAFITGWRWAREALLAGALAGVGLLWAGAGAIAALIAGLALLPLLGSAYTDVPTQLFLRRPTSRGALRKHYDRAGSNPLAVSASRLALLSLIVPGLGLASLTMGVVAWSRIDPKAVPPVGNRSAAAAAVVFSLLTLAIWGIAWIAQAP